MADREDYNSPEYLAWRRRVMARDDFTCQLSGIKGGELEVHHIVPWAKSPHLRYVVSNGITLSKELHQKLVTGNEEKYEEQFKEAAAKNNANYLNKSVSGKKKGKTTKPKFAIGKWRKRNPRLRY